MVTLLSGLVGGLVATIVMTVFMMTLGDDSPPPTAVFWSKFVGDGPPGEFMMQGIIMHLFYGTVAGAIFALIVDLFGFVSVETTAMAVVWGLAYGILLFVGAAVFWMKIVLAIDAEMKEAGMFLFFHLVYGLVLGAWVGLGILA